MKFTIQRNELERALKRASTAMAGKALSLPILTHLRVTAGDGTVEFLGTNLDLTVRASAPADVSRSGVMCVPGARLLGIVSLLPAGPVTIAADKGKVLVSAGDHRSRLATMESDEFPHRDQLATPPGTVQGSVVHAVADQVSWVCVQESSRPIAAGVECLRVKEGCQWQAYNGNSMLARLLTPGLLLDIPQLIPATSLRAAAKLIDPAAEVDIRVDNDRISFTQPGIVIDARCIEGPFPKTDQLFNVTTNHTLRVALADLIPVLQRLATVLGDARIGAAFKFDPAGKHSAKSSGQDVGTITESLAASFEGQPLAVAISVPLLTGIARVFQRAGCDVIRIRFSNPQGQFRVDAEGHDGAPEVIAMPLHSNVMEYIDDEAEAISA